MEVYDVRRQMSNGRSIYDIPLRVTFYARVSTDKDEQVGSLLNQVGYYTEYIQKNPHWQYQEGYIDEGISGSTAEKRGSFQRMIADAGQGRFDLILTKEISRFSRNTLDSIQYTQQLLQYGVGVLFQSDNINTLLPDAELRLTIMASIAQDEVRKISERVRFGFKRSVEQGRVLGSNRIWGYSKNDGKLIIDEEQAELVRYIFDQYANHHVGIRTLATRLSEQGWRNSNGNVFSFSSIKGILTNPKYKGYYCGNKTTKVDYKLKKIKEIDPAEWVTYKDESGEIVPAMISEALWDKANAILQKRREKMSSDNPTSYQNKYTYSGKLYCMTHGVAYHRSFYRYASGDKEIWRCKLYEERGRSGCDGSIIYTSELDEMMKGFYDDLIINRAEIAQRLASIYGEIMSASGLAGEIKKQQQQANEIVQRKDKLLDLSLKSRITDEEFENRNTTFNQQMVDIRQRIDDLEAQVKKNEEVKKSTQALHQAIASEINFADGLDENVVSSLLERVEVYQTTDRANAKIKVYLKVIQEQANFFIRRVRAQPSVCSTQYI